MKKPLPEEVGWHLQTADGYMDLKLWERARAELEHVPDPFHDHPAYLHAQLRLASGTEAWPAVAELAGVLQKLQPEEPGFWIQRAFAVRRMESIEEARTILLSALRRFPDEPVIPFNMACYACQLGELPLAREFLKKAEALEPAFRELALEDEDLEPLWPELQE